MYVAVGMQSAVVHESQGSSIIIFSEAFDQNTEGPGH